MTTNITEATLKLNSVPHHFLLAHACSLPPFPELEPMRCWECQTRVAWCVSGTVRHVWLACFAFRHDLAWQLTEGWEQCSCRPWSARRNYRRHKEDRGGVPGDTHPVVFCHSRLSEQPPVSWQPRHHIMFALVQVCLCSLVIFCTCTFGTHIQKYPNILYSVETHKSLEYTVECFMFDPL